MKFSLGSSCAAAWLLVGFLSFHHEGANAFSPSTIRTGHVNHDHKVRMTSLTMAAEGGEDGEVILNRWSR